MSFLNKIQGSVEKVYPDKHRLDILCGAFGLTLNVPCVQNFVPGKVYTFLTHMIWREDQQQIFGFSSFEQREAFYNLIKVRTLGPKIALNILSSDFNQFLKACSEQDKDRLTKIPGVGPKMAVKILQQFEGQAIVAEHQQQSADFLDFKNTLLTLGFSSTQIYKVSQQLEDSATLEEKIKQALKILGESHVRTN